MEELGVDTRSCAWSTTTSRSAWSRTWATATSGRNLAQIATATSLIIGTPIWFGVRSAVSQMVIERLDGSYSEGDPDTGQYPLYGKVAG